MLTRCIATLLLWLFAATSSAAQLYSPAELDQHAVRLRNAVIKIYEIGIKPSLTGEERQALGAFEFRFPPPGQGEALMNFAATTDGRFLIMPLMSLKALEDMTTAYAWLYHQGMSLSSIDLYFAMLRYRPAADFPGGRHPPILEALGVPADALKQPKVDDLSLRLRNEAYAFVIAHELGHIRFRHKPLDAIAPGQAQADEAESDRFALDIFARTATPGLGALLFFQAQVYSLLHRHEFKSEEDWLKHLKLKMTHPLSVDRIESITAYIDGPLARAVPGEAALWRDIAASLRTFIPVMRDEALARCIVRLAKEADLAILKPRRGVEQAEMMARCRGAG